MKKYIVPALLIAVTLISSCGKDKAPAPTPTPEAAAATRAPSKKPVETEIVIDESENYNTEDKSGESEPEDDAAEKDADEGGSAEESTNDNSNDSISIINGSSTEFYAIYLSSSADGNPGENIIGDSPLGEGEEITLPFANAPEEALTIIVEDANGIQYSTGGINLSNGLAVELRLNNGRLEAVTQ